MDRRKFLKATSLAALASFSSDSFAKIYQDIPLIDTHQHLWDLDIFPLKWVKPPLNKSYLTEDYLEATRGLHIVKAIYMEVGVPREYRKREAEWAIRVCEDPGNPTVAAVISADPSQSGFESYIRSFEGNPYLKGIRYSLGDGNEPIPAHVLTNVKLLGKLGFSMDMNLSTDKLMKGVRVLDQCPDVKFILNHCGNADPVAFFPADRISPRKPEHDPEEWYRKMELLAQRSNLVCKISGLVDNVLHYPLTAADLSPIVHFCLEEFGPDRVMFGGDWPVCERNMSLRAWVELLKELVRPMPVCHQRKLFYDNAQAFYGLS